MVIYDCRKMGFINEKNGGGENMKENVKVSILFALAALYAAIVFVHFDGILLDFEVATTFNVVVLGLVCAFSALGLVHFIDDTITSFVERRAKNNAADKDVAQQKVMDNEPKNT